MAIYYKWSGVIADLALLFNFVFLIALLAGLEATLTLPGMAGIVGSGLLNILAAPWVVTA